MLGDAWFVITCSAMCSPVCIVMHWRAAPHLHRISPLLLAALPGVGCRGLAAAPPRLPCSLPAAPPPPPPWSRHSVVVVGGRDGLGVGWGWGASRACLIVLCRGGGGWRGVGGEHRASRPFTLVRDRSQRRSQPPANRQSTIHAISPRN